MHKHKIKILRAMFGLALAFASVTFIAPVTTVQATTTTGTLTEDFTYSIDESNNITVTGYSGTALVVDIENAFKETGTVVAVQKEAFKNNANITKVVLPESCSTIGQSAFANCTALKEISIKNKVEIVLGENVFYGCKSLTKVNWDENLKVAIPKTTFQGATSLATLTLPLNTSSIGEEAFSDCDSLTSISIPAACSSIATKAFQGSGLKTINFREGTENEAENEAETITIGSYAFQCTNIKNVTLPKRCSAVGYEAFTVYDGGLDTLTIQSDVEFADKALHAWNNETQNTIIYGCDSYNNAIKYAYNNSEDVKFHVPCSEIKITKQPSTNKYIYNTDVTNEDLIKGLEVSATYKDAATDSDNKYDSAVIKEQTEASSENPANFSTNLIVTGYDKSKVGKQTITVEYGGQKITFDVYNRYDFSNLKGAVSDASSIVYTGSALKPNVVVKKDTTSLDSSWYTIQYANNINACVDCTSADVKPTITLTGDDEHITGTYEIHFNIQKKPISDDDVIGELEESLVYSGAELKPTDFSLTYKETEIPYTIKRYYNNINVTTSDSKAYCYVTVNTDAEGSENYTGDKCIYFDIAPLSLADALKAGILTIKTGDDQTYTGSILKPTKLVVTRPALVEGDRDIVLTLGTDYIVKGYQNNVNAGEAIVTITGNGNYTDSVTATYNILPAILLNENVTVSDTKEYTGEVLNPDITVKFPMVEDGESTKVTLEQDKDYIITIEAKQSNDSSSEDTSTNTMENTNDTESTQADENADDTESTNTDENTEVSNGPVAVGDYVVTITGIGNFKGTFTRDYRIKGHDISKADFELESEYAYTGEEICPEIKVMLNKEELVEDKDYQVTYKDNIEPGQATVTVTGIGNYEGEMEKTFTVLGKPLYVEEAEDNAVIAEIEDQSYTCGREITPAITVTKGDVTLEENKDYTVTYENNTSIGTATVIVNGIAQYSGEITAEFEIVARDISTCSIVLKEDDTIYTGEQVEPLDYITLDDDVLEKDTDYTIQYSDNVNAGTGNITVTGCGNFSGEVVLEFEIDKKSIASLTATLENVSTTYTGQAIAPAVSVVDGGKTLDANRDYTVTYTNNINVGTATVTITGKGNYDGQITKNFIIESAPAPVTTETPATPAPTTEAPAAVQINVGDVVTVTNVIYQIVVPATDGTGEVEYDSLTADDKKSATTVNIPDTVSINGVDYKVTSIKAGTFKNCKKLKKVTIGKNVKSIGKQAFAGCKNLKTIVIKSNNLTKKNLNKNAFKGIGKKTAIKVPKKKYKEYKKLFQSKGLSKSVKIKK